MKTLASTPFGKTNTRTILTYYDCNELEVIRDLEILDDRQALT